MKRDYMKKISRRKTIVCVAVALVLVCAMFLSVVDFLYTNAEEEAFEALHLQTRQIKEDIHLQMISDRENLQTMANFAAKLHKDGEDYSLLFNSFKPIGLLANIGILTPDNMFTTKAGGMDLTGKISFAEEAQKGAYFSGRVKDLTNQDGELVRSAVPIKVDNEVVGMLYGVIKLDSIGERYRRMAQELDAQLFVYGKEDGILIVDTVHDELGNISFLKDRKYNEGYSYEEFASTDKGFISFVSAYRDENTYVHYSAIDDLGWMIAMGRYESQVFANVRELTREISKAAVFMMIVAGLLLLVLIKNEKQTGAVVDCASEVRKTLLETAGNEDHITDALKQVCLFTGSRSAIFFDTNGGSYSYFAPGHRKTLASEEDRGFFMGELLRYIAEFYTQRGASISVNRIRATKRLSKTNPAFYQLLKDFAISEVVFSATIDNNNNVTILSVVNAKQSQAAELLAEKVAACFSMALYNRNHLNRTRLAATMDSLTGALNRMAYMNDVSAYNQEKPLNFACIYADVNELHMVNNKYGHAAGDEMLLYIANTLKEVFFGHKIYRMGGDEFLVFCQGVGQEEIKKGIDLLFNRLNVRGYHVALGLSYRSQNTNTEEMVKEAEVRMYEAKAEYYQSRETQNDAKPAEETVILAQTGIAEIDTMLSILKENYNGIYRVNLDTDTARRVLMPSYLHYNETEAYYSKLYAKYVTEMVRPEFHRSMMAFPNYEVLKRQLAEGKVPRITYKKVDGETVVLSVYKLCDGSDFVADTLWIFAKSK